MTTRRSFLASILAAGVAPAAIGSGILMPVRKVASPRWIFGVDWALNSDTGVVWVAEDKGCVVTRQDYVQFVGLDDTAEEWRIRMATINAAAARSRSFNPLRGNL